MTITNIDVKLEALKKGVKMYELPAQMGMSISTFNNTMRVPLSEDFKQKVLDAIQQIADSRTKNQ